MISCGPEFLADTSFARVVGSYALANGRLLESEIPGTTARVKLGQMSGDRQRTVTIRPVGTGSDNQTYETRIYLRRRTFSNSGDGTNERTANQVLDGSIVLLGTMACTLGTGLGKTGGVISASVRTVDTLVFTPSAYATHLQTAFSASIATHSPADNSQAEVVLPDAFGAYELLFETVLGTASGAAFLIELQT
jgi:hypothetical protein